MSLLELFCDVDDFLVRFMPQWKESRPIEKLQPARAYGPTVPKRGDDNSHPFPPITVSDIQSLLYGTCSGSSHQRISSLGELYALRGTDPTHDASEAFLFADPLWCLHRHQLHRLNFAFCL